MTDWEKVGYLVSGDLCGKTGAYPTVDPTVLLCSPRVFGKYLVLQRTLLAEFDLAEVDVLVFDTGTI